MILTIKEQMQWLGWLCFLPWFWTMIHLLIGYILSRAFPTALGGNDEKFKYDMQKFLIRANLLTSQSSSNYERLKGYVQW